MTDYRKNRIGIIRSNIFDCFLIILNLTWRLFAGIIMSILACGFAIRQAAGHPYQWVVYLTALVLFFCPWGSPIRNELAEESRQKQMERQGIIFWITFIRPRSLIVRLVLLIIDVYVNGVFGIVLGWKYFFALIYNFIENIKQIKRLWY
ncbi:unknown protein (plasmid) [Calothrix sp. PCC 7716]|nr:unknown protein [Calothrix sp. PCC 7716]